MIYLWANVIFVICVFYSDLCFVVLKWRVRCLFIRPIFSFTLVLRLALDLYISVYVTLICTSFSHLKEFAFNKHSLFLGNGDIQWCFSQVKGTLDDDVTEGRFYFPYPLG